MTKKLLLVVCSFMSLPIFAQFTENFSDNEVLTNPAWNGDIVNFVVLDDTLRSNGPEATAEIYLSTPSVAVNNATWEFTVKMDFAPSASNQAKFYLMSDNSNLIGDLNGYYISIGQSGDDQINFYRQDGPSSNLLFAGSTLFTSSPVLIRIKVTRDDAGSWQIWSDSSGGTTFTSDGASFVENTYSASTYFGIVCKHTSTRNDLFSFDNISVSLPPDLTAPLLSSVVQISTTQLDLKFNEELNKISAETVTNYAVDNGPNNSILSELDVVDKSLVHLTFLTPFINGSGYELQVENMEDLAGNVGGLKSKSFTFLIPEFAEFGDIIINEIMADPTPIVDLPDAEYVEIYNSSNKYIDLADYTLSGSIITTEQFVIAPNTYLILCDDSNTVLFSPFGNTLGIGSWNTLTNVGETITLKDELRNLIIDELSYDDSWYNDSEKVNGGYSLELINANSLCDESSKWTGSLDSSGGTPGMQNFVYAIDDQAPQLQSVVAVKSDSLVLEFDELIVAIDEAVLTISPSIDITNIFEINNQFSVKLNNELQNGIIYSITVGGLSDCSGNVIDEQNTSFRLADIPNDQDIIINEIMADPFDQVGLPESEYVEIYNQSNKYFNLAALILNDKPLIDAYTEMAPHSYVILCPQEFKEEFGNYGTVIGMAEWDVLTNIGETITLKYQVSERIIDEVTYSISWYNDIDKADGGFSLELINPGSLCNQSSNWIVSNSQNGGTPGTENSVLTMDNQEPQLLSVMAESSDSLVLQFNEALTSIDMGDYYFPHSNSVIKAILLEPTILILKLKNKLSTGQVYSISVSGLSDCIGNKMIDAQTINFRLPDIPELKNLVINEIMADPFDQVGLPGSEFIEIYNRSNKYFNLAHFALNNKTISDSYFELAPYSYAILCPKEFEEDFLSYGTTIGLKSWDVLSNGGEKISITYPTTSFEVDVVDYSLSWYNSSYKNDGGWSLELIDSENLCSSEDNWTVSINPNGGTPGTENSVKSNKPDITGPELKHVTVISPDTLQLMFNENLDSLSVHTAQYTIDETISIQVKYESLKSALLILDNELQRNIEYTIAVNDLKDCTGNIISSDNNSLNFLLPEKASQGDIVLNEVLFNPRFDAPDFVELYNNSSKYIDLQDWKIANKNSNGEPDNIKSVCETPLVMAPQSYIVLTTDVTALSNEYPAGKIESFLEVNSLPSFANIEGSFVILKPDSSVYEEFDYHEDFHHSLLNIVEGMSLERIDVNGTTNSSDNWHSAATTIMATPGYVNSQVKGALFIENAITISPQVFVPNQNGIDDYATIHYEFGESGFVVSIRIIDDRGRVVKSLIEQQTLPLSGDVHWDGTTIDGNKARIGSYMVYVEAFDMSGNVKNYRERVIVGSEW